MNEEICNSFKAQLLDNISTIVFEDVSKWKNTLAFLSYNPQFDIINILSILNSRVAPINVMKLNEWQTDYPDVGPKGMKTAIPLIDNKCEAIIEYDGWDFQDMEFKDKVPPKPPNLKELMNVDDRKPEYWQSLLLDLINETSYFTCSEVQENHIILNFVENSILWAIDPVLQMQINTTNSLDPMVIKDASKEMLLNIFSNILLILNKLPGYYKRIDKEERELEERIERDMEIWNRMDRPLPVRIQDARNILLVQKISSMNSSASGNETERNKDLDERLQNEINGTKKKEL